jgi:FkbH-like protein
MMKANLQATHDLDPSEERTIKLLVWDLDHTIWRGTLLEGDDVALRSGVREALAGLDERGILCSIASKNDQESALKKLADFNIAEFFLFPRINWNSKSFNINVIAKDLNIGLDAVAFIDDEEFEREEVRQGCPQVTILAASALENLLERKEFTPTFTTQDSARRRRMYLAEIDRRRAETEFVGPSESFLASLEMKLVLSPAQEDDLQRAEELTRRTNQLNTTGYTYSYDELNELRSSSNHLLLVASLDDRFGTYGKVGLTLVERSAEFVTIKLLLVSCRVMSRGIGTVMLNCLAFMSQKLGIPLRGEFRPTGRNRPMLIAYKFTGFREVERSDDKIVLELEAGYIPVIPAWIDVRDITSWSRCEVERAV